MARKANRLNVYILGIAVIVAAILGYYLPTKRPESGVTLTPKEYIELVEKKKQQRLRYEREHAEAEAAKAEAEAAKAAAQDTPAASTDPAPATAPLPGQATVGD
jgi:hypothetical protein